MSVFDKAKELAGQLIEVAGQVIGKVRHALPGGDSGPTRASEAAESFQPPMVDTPKTIPSDGAVTPADVAESVNDPDLEHPEPPS